MTIPEIQFHRGTYQLNPNANFNFQLNRVIQWDDGRLEDVRPIAGRIHNSSDWKRELIALGDTAVSEGRTENAIAYYRMSEFFMYDGDPDKPAYYQKATAMFYDFYCDYFDSGLVHRLAASNKGVELPILHVERNEVDVEAQCPGAGERHSENENGGGTDAGLAGRAGQERREMSTSKGNKKQKRWEEASPRCVIWRQRRENRHGKDTY